MADDRKPGGQTRPVHQPQGKDRDPMDESAPRLPHEHDESSDSQESQGGEPTEVGKQAHEDVERGLVDTDRAPVTDRVYRDIKR